MGTKLKKSVALNQKDLVPKGVRCLKEQMNIFKYQQGYENRFDITDSDIEDAQLARDILSEDEESDIMK